LRSTNYAGEIRVADLTSALREAGVTNVGVPQSWDGVEIGIEFGPTVYVNARGFMLIQFLPGQITMPPGFPMAQFIEVLLRIGGMSEFQAQTLAARMGTNPAILLGIPSDSQLNVREVPLRAGHAVLIENASGRPASPACAPCPGPQGLVLAWQTPNRVYILKSDGLTEARAVEVANSLA
jgi:hypothetical protein